MEKITDEIERFRKNNGLSQKNIAEILGCTEKTYASRVAKSEDFDFSRVVDLVNFYRELPYGDDITEEDYPLMYRQSIVSYKDVDTDLLKSLPSVLDGMEAALKGDLITAPIISAKASAGTGAIHYYVETVGQLMIDRMMFKILPNLQNIRAVEVVGDSMYPTLKEGDYVIIEENTGFTGEGIYVLQFDNMLLVKRLQGSSRGIRVLSDNMYYKEDEYIPEDDQRSFHIVGKVVLRIQR